MTNTTDTTNYVECIGCGDEVDADECESVQTHARTLETPAEYESVCSACAAMEDGYDGPDDYDAGDAADRAADRYQDQFGW